MKFDEFLNLVKTVKILYGREHAHSLFIKNYKKFYNLNDIGLEDLPDFEDIPLQPHRTLLH